MNIEFKACNSLCMRVDIICSDFGMDVEAALKLLVHTTVSRNELPFVIDSNLRTIVKGAFDDAYLPKKSINIDVDDYICNQFKIICDKNFYSPIFVGYAYLTSIALNYGIPFSLTLSSDRMIDKLESRINYNYAKPLDTVLETFPGEERQNMRNKIVSDIRDITERTMFTAWEYFELNLYNYDEPYWLDHYLCMHDTHYLLDKLNNLEECPFDSGNKYAAYQFFKDFYKRDVMFIKKPSDVFKVSKMLEKHDRIIMKPIYGSISKGILVINKTDDVKELVTDALKKFSEGFVAEEIIVQHDDLAKYNESSLNTFRFLTLKDSKDHVDVFGVFRVGTTDAITDSIDYGGLTCGLDLNTGEIINVRTATGVCLENNPKNNVRILGGKIPDIQGAIDLVTELAIKTPGYRYIGWDIALSKDHGWVVVEFNGKSDPVSLEAALGYGLKPAFEKLYDDLGIKTGFPRYQHRFFH